jgi:hypothetical protein
MVFAWQNRRHLAPRRCVGPGAYGRPVRLSRPLFKADAARITVQAGRGSERDPKAAG